MVNNTKPENLKIVHSFDVKDDYGNRTTHDTLDSALTKIKELVVNGRGINFTGIVDVRIIKLYEHYAFTDHEGDRGTSKEMGNAGKYLRFC